ncbi:MAG: hypothetical protein KAS94_14755, partial [Desulfobulbaceae bacterium]|nr:hypothetical protein [Desulfobulbaceae bacterium]
FSFLPADSDHSRKRNSKKYIQTPVSLAEAKVILMILERNNDEYAIEKMKEIIEAGQRVRAGPGTYPSKTSGKPFKDFSPPLLLDREHAARYRRLQRRADYLVEQEFEKKREPCDKAGSPITTFVDEWRMTVVDIRIWLYKGIVQIIKEIVPVEKLRAEVIKVFLNFVNPDSNKLMKYLFELWEMFKHWQEGAKVKSVRVEVFEVVVEESESREAVGITRRSNQSVGAVVVSSISPVKDLNDPVWQAYYASKLKDEAYVKANWDKLVAMVAALDDVSILKDAAWQPMIEAVQGVSVSEKKEVRSEKVRAQEHLPKPEIFTKPRQIQMNLAGKGATVVVSRPIIDLAQSIPVARDSKLPLGHRWAVFALFNFSPISGGRTEGKGSGQKGHNAGQAGGRGNMLRFARSKEASKNDVSAAMFIMVGALQGYQQERLNAIIQYLHASSDLIQPYVAPCTAAKETAKDHIPAQFIKVYNLFILNWLGAFRVNGGQPGSIRVPSNQGSGVRGQGSEKTTIPRQLIEEITTDKSGDSYLNINRLLLIHPWLVESGILKAAYYFWLLRRVISTYRPPEFMNSGEVSPKFLILADGRLGWNETDIISIPATASNPNVVSPRLPEFSDEESGVIIPGFVKSRNSSPVKKKSDTKSLAAGRKSTHSTLPAINGGVCSGLTLSVSYLPHPEGWGLRKVEESKISKDDLSPQGKRTLEMIRIAEEQLKRTKRALAKARRAVNKLSSSPVEQEGKAGRIRETTNKKEIINILENWLVGGERRCLLCNPVLGDQEAWRKEIKKPKKGSVILNYVGRQGEPLAILLAFRVKEHSSEWIYIDTVERDRSLRGQELGWILLKSFVSKYGKKEETAWTPDYRSGDIETPGAYEAWVEKGKRIGFELEDEL